MTLLTTFEACEGVVAFNLLGGFREFYVFGFDWFFLGSVFACWCFYYVAGECDLMVVIWLLVFLLCNYLGRK